MKPFKEIQRNIQYEESIARLRRCFELAVKRLVSQRVRVPRELEKIADFDDALDSLLQK